MSDERKQKLKSILYAIRELDDFSSDGAKQVCRDANAAYVTKVLNQLTRDGLLSRVERDKQEFFRWVRNANCTPENWIDSQVYGDQIKQSPEYTDDAILDRDYETRLHEHYNQKGYWIK